MNNSGHSFFKLLAVAGGFLALLLPGSLGVNAQRVELGPAPRLSESEFLQVDEGRAMKASSLDGLSVDTSNRAAVIQFYNNVYLASESIDAGWGGNIPNCAPGTTTAVFKDAILLRINYYRAMTGLPAGVIFDSALNAKCQQAALMMIAEGKLSHTPDSSFKCYTEEGREAAGKSNLALGSYGPHSIDRYIEDSGTFNYAVGHRRWILEPRQILMGSGTTTAVNGDYTGSDALWVIGNFTSRPASPEWVAWPNSGFVPSELVFPRWSFSANLDRNRVDFASASVTMTENGNPVALTIVSSADTGYGDDTIVWEPQGLNFTGLSEDRVFHISIDNVLVDGSSRSYSYQVTVIDPGEGCWPLYDMNGDGWVDPQDLYLLIGDLGGNPSDLRSDFNCDGRVDYRDLALFSTQWKPGEGN